MTDNGRQMKTDHNTSLWAFGSGELKWEYCQQQGKAKIRYVGGMCIAKTRKHISNMLKYHIGDLRQSIKALIAILEKQLNLLHSFESSIEERKKCTLW